MKKDIMLIPMDNQTTLVVREDKENETVELAIRQTYSNYDSATYTLTKQQAVSLGVALCG